MTIIDHTDDDDHHDEELRIYTRMLLRQDQPELRPHDLMQFALNIENLNLAADMLIFCRTKQRWSELLGEFVYERRHRLAKISNIIRFLLIQGLLVRLKPDRDGSVLKAIPRAVEELVYRLAHEGRSSKPPKPPEPEISFEDRCRQARDKVEETLKAAGYYQTDKGIRLRVVG